MIALFAVSIGLMLYSADSERRCAFIRPIPKPFTIHLVHTPHVYKEYLTNTAILRCSAAQDLGEREVQSITITHHDSKVAMVTTDLPPKVMNGATNLQVGGQTVKDTSNMPYIELIWQLPSKTELQVRNKRISFFKHTLLTFIFF